MNNLTTRRIVLGLLMALVLAFSVQDIADALSFTTSRSGDLQTVNVGDTFNITFTVSQNPAMTRPGYHSGSGDTNQSYYLEVGDPGLATEGYHPLSVIEGQDTDGNDVSGNDTLASAGVAHYYNDEAIAISSATNPEGSTLTIKRGTFEVGELASAPNRLGSERQNDSQPPSGVSNGYLYEAATNTNQQLTADTASMITLTCTADTAGEYRITITDVTPSVDFPATNPAPNTQASITFAIYVVPETTTIAINNIFAITRTGSSITTREGSIITRVSENGDSNINFSDDTGSAEVTYQISGGGSLYVNHPIANNPDGAPSTSRLETSTDADVYLRMSQRTNRVTVTVGDQVETAKTFIYVYGRPVLTITASSNNQEGVWGGQLENPLIVRLTDGNRTALSGVPVGFDPEFAFDPLTPGLVTTDSNAMIPVPNTTVYVGDTTRSILEGAVLDVASVPIKATARMPNKAGAGVKMYVRTESNGEARAYYQLPAAGPSKVPTSMNVEVAVDFPNAYTQKFSATGVNEVTGTTLEALSVEKVNNQNYDLVARVRKGGRNVSVQPVTFSTDKGFFTRANDAILDDAVKTRSENTKADGTVKVRYFVGEDTGSRTVFVRTVDSAFSNVIEDSFTINPGGSSGPSTGSGTSQPRNVILIELSSTTGEPGDEIDVRVTSDPPGESVNINSGELSDSDFSGLSGTTPFTRTLILPDEEDRYTFSATRLGFTSDSATVTVEAELGTLSITAIGTPEAGLQTFSISAVDADGDRASAPFTARLSGTGFTSRNVEIADGRGNARVTLPTAASLYTLTVSATGYEDGETPVRIAGTGQQQVADEDEEEVEEEVTVAAEPDSIEITGPSTRSGTVNEELDTPLLVRVLDDDGDGLEGARVFYRVTGRGRISDGSRGGRSVGVVTDDDGYARANFTPTAGGSSTVRVNTDDVSRIVTFTITTGSAPTPRGPGTGGTPGTSVSPVVHVGAASRPPMLWVDGGAIYALVGASPQRFAASVDNALNITVGGGKVYWTEKTGESGGTINSANLNGSDVTELTSIKAVPMGIAVDVAGSKLYWTNSRGRIQSADLDGSGITNVMQNLQSPMDLALAGGNAYWTQGNGSVRFVNLRGQKVVRNVSTGTDTPGSLVIGGGKVYWTETTGESGGTVNSANLNGTGATQLASILAAPMGIAVDGSRSKLYWTNARGRVQSANLDGSGIKNVVSGLGSPGELVLSNSIAAPAATTTTRTTTTASNKYDVNGDGSVNNADSDAITVAIAAGATDAKYDVNGDGTVNVFDLVEIIANRDPGAAGAPTLFGMKMSAAQIDSLQEQIDLLIAMNDRSPAALRTLIYLQQLLVTARPEKTLLLANYPNPFNPETWIPYELATDTHVRLTIYNTQGVVIRTLQFGHQSAGYYVGRDRAAYWDGRNALGEQVASGLYFYQLETDEMSLMRKMVILK